MLVSLDWTSRCVRLHTLMAAVVVVGRAVPMCWQSYADKLVYKSQNALEYAMLLRLKAALHPGSSRRDPGRPGVPGPRRAGGPSARDWA